MTNIKNLAEFKRAIKVGTKIETTWHQWDGKKGENNYIEYADHTKQGEVSIVQSSQFAVKRQKSDGSYSDSWMQFPKASECTFKDNSITISYETLINTETREKKIIPFITYKLI
jgi:hypothetical protein